MKKTAWVLTLILFFTACSKSGSDYVNNPDAPVYLHSSPVGASAKELLTSSTYQSLKIEILYMTGFAPDAAAISHLQSTLADVLNKPSGIKIVTKEIPGSSSGNFTVNDIISIEKNNRTAFTTGGEIAVCV